MVRKFLSIAVLFAWVLVQTMPLMADSLTFGASIDAAAFTATSQTAKTVADCHSHTDRTSSHDSDGDADHSILKFCCSAVCLLDFVQLTSGEQAEFPHPDWTAYLQGRPSATNCKPYIPPPNSFV